MNELNKKNANIFDKYFQTIFMIVALISTVIILVYYFLYSALGDITTIFNYTIIFYVILIIISFVPKLKLTWAPVSFLLVAISGIFFQYFDFISDMSNKVLMNNVLIIILSVAVLLDYIYFVIEAHTNSELFNLIKKVLLIIVVSIFAIGSALLVIGLFDSLDKISVTDVKTYKQVYIPFSIIITVVGFIYYTFLISKPAKLISNNKIKLINGTVLAITFILTLIIMLTFSR